MSESHDTRLIVLLQAWMLNHYIAYWYETLQHINSCFFTPPWMLGSRIFHLSSPSLYPLILTSSPQCHSSNIFRTPLRPWFAFQNGCYSCWTGENYFIVMGEAGCEAAAINKWVERRPLRMDTTCTHRNLLSTRPWVFCHHSSLHCDGAIGNLLFVRQRKYESTSNSVADWLFPYCAYIIIVIITQLWS